METIELLRRLGNVLGPILNLKQGECIVVCEDPDLNPLAARRFACEHARPILYFATGEVVGNVTSVVVVIPGGPRKSDPPITVYRICRYPFESKTLDASERLGFSLDELGLRW